VWVLCTFAVMVGGILAWVFSPLLFHNDMSILLILLMFSNLVVGGLMLPVVLASIRPRFLTRFEGAQTVS